MESAAFIEWTSYDIEPGSEVAGGVLMQIGTVKWFNNAKGYGFILSDECDEELFAHFSAIVMEGYKSLKAGQAVKFEIQQGPKGLHAINIQPTET